MLSVGWVILVAGKTPNYKAQVTRRTACGGAACVMLGLTLSSVAAAQAITWLHRALGLVWVDRDPSGRVVKEALYPFPRPIFTALILLGRVENCAWVLIDQAAVWLRFARTGQWTRPLGSGETVSPEGREWVALAVGQTGIGDLFANLLFMMHSARALGLKRLFVDWRCSS